MSWKNSHDIHWIMTKDPLEHAGILDETYDPIETKKVMNQEIPINKGDEIVVLYDDSKPVLVTKYKKSDRKLKSVLAHLYKVLDTEMEIDNDIAEVVYSRISGFYRSEMRLELINKYEAGKLKPKDLLGDHVFSKDFKEMERKNLLIIGLEVNKERID
jgi:hypothetical protein